MMKPITKIVFILAVLSILCSATLVTAQKRQVPQTTIQLANQLTDNEGKSFNKAYTFSNGQFNRYVTVSGHNQRSILSTPTPNIHPDPQDQLPQLLNLRRTFVIYLYYNDIRDFYTLDIADFTWETEHNRYVFDQGDNTYEFVTGGLIFAELSELEIIFDFDIPYTISYSYQIQTHPLDFAPFGDFLSCRVMCSPMKVESGIYKATETYNGESARESHYDLDGQVIKRALNYEEGDLTKSMAYFKVNSNHYAQNNYVYQRGLNFLSAIVGDGKTPTGGAMIGSYAQTLGFNIVETMDQFWIESGFEGTIGDRYNSQQRFRIEPR